jgi:hypothetical protein
MNKKLITMAIVATMIATLANASEDITVRTGWLGGGHNQTDECNRLVVQAHPGRAFDILQKGESARWTGPFNRTRQYKYWCTVRLK